MVKQVFSCKESGEEDDNSSGEEEQRDEEVHESSKHLPGAVQVLPHSLSDQFKLLTPTSTQNEITDLYSTVNKSSKTQRTMSEGGDARHRSGSDGLLRNRSISLTASEAVSDKPEKEISKPRSMFIHDLTPPWKQMVNNSFKNL